jgi:hypothetical protein
MKGYLWKWTLIAIAVVNFFIPFFFILTNPRLSKKQKVRMLIRAEGIMAIISGSAIALVLLRYS